MVFITEAESVYCAVRTGSLNHTETLSLVKFNRVIDIRTSFKRGRDSSVGIATRYDLEGQEFESRWGRDFPQPSRKALCNGCRISPGGKTPGAWR